MKILVISDTHGDINHAVRILEQESFDYCIHLGDVVSDCEDLESIFPRQKFIFVKGNNDFWHRDSSFPDERIFSLGDKKFFVCHGHKYGVKYSLDLLRTKAREQSADIVLYGHTHRKYLEQSSSLLVMNPGSSGSHGIIIIENGQIDAQLF